MQSEVPEGKTMLPAACQMKRKRDVKTRKTKKHKARLNTDGSRMKEGVNCDVTCAPVAKWNSMRTVLTMTASNG